MKLARIPRIFDEQECNRTLYQNRALPTREYSAENDYNSAITLMADSDPPSPVPQRGDPVQEIDSLCFVES